MCLKKRVLPVLNRFYYNVSVLGFIFLIFLVYFLQISFENHETCIVVILLIVILLTTNIYKYNLHFLNKQHTCLI